MTSEHRSEARSKNAILISAGEFFLDMIFFDLDALPRLGEELKTDNFAFSLGGGAAISGSAAARLGRSTQLVTVWGDSPIDAEARSRLRRFEVSTDWSRVYPETISGLSVAVSTRDDRYFLTFPGANRFLEEYLLSSEGLAACSHGGHVHFALTPSRWEPFEERIRELGGRGITTSWDLGWDPAAAASPGFQGVCRTLDVLFMNEMEALSYTGQSDAAAALEHLSRVGRTVVIKRGSRGAVARTRLQEPVEAKALPVEAVDSTGAGDAFNGAFLHAWMNGEPLQDCLAAGNVCGALSTLQPGGVAGLPSREEFLARLPEVERSGP